MSRGRAKDGVTVRMVYGQSYAGRRLYRVSRPAGPVYSIDAIDAAEAKAEARRRWARLDAERAAREARRERERGGLAEDWHELAAVMWAAVLRRTA